MGHIQNSKYNSPKIYTGDLIFSAFLGARSKTPKLQDQTIFVLYSQIEGIKLSLYPYICIARVQGCNANAWESILFDHVHLLIQTRFAMVFVLGGFTTYPKDY